jgi:predicted amidophosphoribosyltransferase
LSVVDRYWRDDADVRTEVGHLMAAAKDEGDGVALDLLTRRLHDHVVTARLPTGAMVTPVPPGPDRQAHPVPSLAAAVATALDTTVAPILTRRHSTRRLRDAPIDGRRAVVEAAGYEVTADVAGADVVLVDDVILTGTTIDHLAGLLFDAGAATVHAVVVCRTRRTPPTPAS